MKIPIYQVDAFTGDLFGGNPAAVCPLKEWLPEGLMQKIGRENNLSETAFFVPREDYFELRWFTPTIEVDLCGHATLATAHVLFRHLGYEIDVINFHSKSGKLSVRNGTDNLILNFPADRIEKVDEMLSLNDALGVSPFETYKGNSDFMCVFENQDTIERLKPDFMKLSQIGCRGVIVTARGTNCDFVSRFFAPYAGINEDPVTGSAHTTLTPYWALKLEKNQLQAQQVSARKGYLNCTYLGERVEIGGKAVTYLVGEIEV